MKQGDYVYTPRFCSVKIGVIFDNAKDAQAEGYTEPTHYDNPEYDIHGKHIGTNRMVFAAIRKFSA